MPRSTLSSHPLRAAAAVVLLGAVVRFALLGLAPPGRLVGDENYYLEVAENLAAGRGHLFERDGVVHRSFRPPGHPWLLSLALAGAPAAPERLARLLVAQTLVGSVLIGVVIALGRALFGWREAILAGLLAALDPTLIAHSHYLWSETLTATLLGGAMAAGVAAQDSASQGRAAVAGLLFGLAALTREVALPLCGAFALWSVAVSPRPLGPSVRRAALCLAVAALVVAPWTLRNARLLGRFVPVATVGAFAAREGNTFSREDWRRSELAELKAFRAEYFAIPDEVARLDFARREALELMRAEQPLWLAKKLARTAAGLWGPDSYLFLKISRGAYGEPAPWVLRLLLPVVALGYVALIVAAIAGAAGAQGRGRRAFPALVLGVFTAVHVVANSASRFRLPILPLLLVYASHAALDPRGVLARCTPRARVAAGVLLLVFLGVAVPAFLGDAVALWSRGVYPSEMRP